MKRLWRNRWIRYGWPVVFVILIQAVIVWTLPAVRLPWTPAGRLGLFLLVDVGISVAQWFNYRDARRFARRMADLFEGRCTCDLYWPEFPCKIHTPNKGVPRA